MGACPIGKSKRRWNAGVCGGAVQQCLVYYCSYTNPPHTSVGDPSQRVGKYSPRRLSRRHFRDQCRDLPKAWLFLCWAFLFPVRFVAISSWMWDQCRPVIEFIFSNLCSMIHWMLSLTPTALYGPSSHGNTFHNPQGQTSCRVGGSVTPCPGKIHRLSWLSRRSNMPVVMVLTPLFATSAFLSVSLRRLVSHHISSILAYDDDAESSSNTIEGQFGTTVAIRRGICVSTCIDGDIFKDLFPCTL